MTDDVEATCEWLSTSGFEVSEERFGSMQSGLVRFRRPDITISVLSDRGQWMLDFEVAGETYDLDAVVDAQANRTQWQDREPGRLPLQLPPGVAWREVVPASIRWLLSTPTATKLVRDAQRRRSKALFGHDRPAGT